MESEPHHGGHPDAGRHVCDGNALESIGIMLVCTPIFFPIIQKLGLDPLWFGIIMLINMETASISPPYGLQLFVMKGVASRDTTLGMS
jgi:TRAP-type C4-dicarboxylate transport system permease large subunit